MDVENRVLRYLPLLLLILLGVAVWASGAQRYLDMHMLREHAAALRRLAHAHPILAVAGFVAVIMLTTATSLPGGLIVMMLTGGCVFGTWGGGVAEDGGITLGAVVIYAAVRSSLGTTLREVAERSGGRLKALLEGVREGAFGYILTLRLVPFSPFWLVSAAAATARAPFRAYVLATALGVAPATFIYSGIGAGVGAMIARGQTPRLHELLAAGLVLPLLALGGLSLTATVLIRRRAQTKAARPAA